MILLSVVTVLALLPFVHKAFHIDDPLFVWTAKQIQSSPLDFYRFEVNWYGTKMAASDVIQNPPLGSYYIALVAKLVGWREGRLHLAFLIPAVACTLGTYLLARSYCSRPSLAALAMLFTPAFLISSTNVMCDTMMLAFWVWALVFWEKGIRHDCYSVIIIAGTLAGICVLTKYFGICLVPLMLVSGILRKRRIGLWLTGLVIPILMIGIYEWYTSKLYGHGLFSNAVGYASYFRRTDLATYILVGLAFTGGCVFIPVCYSHLIWRRWQMICAAVLALLLALVLIKIRPARLMVEVQPDQIGFVALHITVFAIVGLALLLIGISDLWRKRDPDSLFLLLWLIGTFIFATFLNWTINARSVLPLIPAATILLMRRIDFQIGAARRTLEPRLLWALLPGAIVTLLVTSGDYWLANSARTAAYVIHEKTKKQLGTVWFQGHWGFQYYMEALGAKPLDILDNVMYSGDFLAMPSNSPNVVSVSKAFSLKTVIEVSPSSLASTMNRDVGAGFYASDWGPLPFWFGRPRSEHYEVLMAMRHLRFTEPREGKRTQIPERKPF